MEGIKKMYSTNSRNVGEKVLVWKEGRVPTIRDLYRKTPRGLDGQDFQPHMIYVAAKTKTVKGAVIICSGGSFQCRNNAAEGYPAAEELSKRGYQAFIMNYRVRPYSMKESSLDLARAIRFVKYHAKEYKTTPEKVALLGFSSGGILCGDVLLHFRGLLNGTCIDSAYEPDAIDEIKVCATGVGLIYSYYGTQHQAWDDDDFFQHAGLPPTFYAYGAKDSLLTHMTICMETLERANIPVERHEYKKFGHGFGLKGEWMKDFDKWLVALFAGKI